MENPADWRIEHQEFSVSSRRTSRVHVLTL
jgi:hypothetical protein